MPEIVLAAFTARFHHCAFGLRYLQANLGELESHSTVLEFDLEKSPIDVAEAILRLSPRIVGLSVHIWNVHLCEQLISLLKALRPELVVVVGGPEVSFPQEMAPAGLLADHVICGEGDIAFRDLCLAILQGQRSPKLIVPVLPDLAQLQLPYRLYSDSDLAHRTVYVESSRGCPFSCEFCLSSLDVPVRRFPLITLLAEMQKLLDRGLLGFKFVDRTFNVDRTSAAAILDFFLERYRPGLFLHFEVIPDCLPVELRQRLKKFPAGTLQLEIGIQTFSEEVAARIGRRQNNALAEENLQWLRHETHAHLHADLIAGLPGESIESFAAGFDRLYRLRPHEIQLGILKRLRGAPISRHTAAWGMVYSSDPPYEVLQTSAVSFDAMQEVRRFARYWDLVGNSGHFIRSLSLLLAKSPWANFSSFSRWLYERTGRTYGIALPRLFELVFDYLGRTMQAGEALAEDYLRPGRRDLPAVLAPHAQALAYRSPAIVPPQSAVRQRRHIVE